MAHLFSCNRVDSLNPVSNNENSLFHWQRPALQKPNIILILGDDVGYEIPTVNGGQSYATPNIDKMAQTGMRFTRCYASPLCSPSRFMLLTGKYNFRNYDKWGIMSDTNRTIANMLKDAGYKTTVAGKWQLDGGDISIHKFGFDEYMVWSPFSPGGLTEEGKGSRYKNPVIYQNGSFIKGEATLGKYGDDMFVEYLGKFIDSNKTKPFFIYYPICLVHQPFDPTPNDPEFATWDPRTSISDSKFFPSMVNYMDVEVGKIIDKVNLSGIAKNTIVIFVGDNGTDGRIISRFDGYSIRGEKSQSIEYGEHVPMLIWWKGSIQPETVNDA